MSSNVVPHQSMADKKVSLQSVLQAHLDKCGFILLHPEMRLVTHMQQELKIQCKAHAHIRDISMKSLVKWTSCVYCNDLAEAMKYYHNQFHDDLEARLATEEWREFSPDVMVSSIGRVKYTKTNIMIAPQEKTHRISINRVPYNIAALIAKAFMIPDHDKLSSKDYVASVIDTNKPVCLDNIAVMSRSKRLQMTNTDKWVNNKYNAVEIPAHPTNEPYVILPQFPQWVIWKDGQIYNHQIRKYVYGTTNTNNSRRYISDHTGTKFYDIARLVVMAFKPPAGHNTYEDYETNNTRVRFIDDTNKSNCHADNLEVFVNFVSKEKQREIQRQENKVQRIKELHDRIQEFVQSRKATLVTDINTINTVFQPFEYVCACKKTFSKFISDVTDLRSRCENCMALLKHQPVFDESQDFTENGVLYKKYADGWIGENGVFLNNMKESININKYRIRRGSMPNLNAKVIMAQIFKVSGYEHIGDPKYRVFFKKLEDGLCPTNLHVCTISEGTALYVQKRFINTCDEKEVEGVEWREIDEFPEWIIYQNGVLRKPTGQLTKGFATSTVSQGIQGAEEPTQNNQYRKVNICSKIVPVHRLVCFAFNPLDGMKTYEEYSVFQVDHIDHSKTNNHASNLRWVTSKENVQAAVQFHKYKNSKPVKQYTIHPDGKRAEYVTTHINVEVAAKATGKPQLYIFKACMKRIYPQRDIWFEFDHTENANKRKCDDDVIIEDDYECKVQRTN